MFQSSHRLHCWQAEYQRRCKCTHGIPRTQLHVTVFIPVSDNETEPTEVNLPRFPSLVSGDVSIQIHRISFFMQGGKKQMKIVKNTSAYK